MNNYLFRFLEILKKKKLKFQIFLKNIFIIFEVEAFMHLHSQVSIHFISVKKKLGNKIIENRFCFVVFKNFDKCLS